AHAAGVGRLLRELLLPPVHFGFAPRREELEDAGRGFDRVHAHSDRHIDEQGERAFDGSVVVAHAPQSPAAERTGSARSWPGDSTDGCRRRRIATAAHASTTTRHTQATHSPKRT